MKVKNYSKQVRQTSRQHVKGEVFPFELGTHLFAIIRRNLLTEKKAPKAPEVQLTFAL